MRLAWVWGTLLIGVGDWIGSSATLSGSNPWWMSMGRGGEWVSSQAEALAQSQSQGPSPNQGVGQLGPVECHPFLRVPSCTQSSRTEVEVELSEAGDDFLSIYITIPEETVREEQTQAISPIRAPSQTPPPIHVPSPVPSL